MIMPEPDAAGTLWMLTGTGSATMQEPDAAKILWMPMGTAFVITPEPPALTEMLMEIAMESDRRAAQDGEMAAIEDVSDNG